MNTNRFGRSAAAATLAACMMWGCAVTDGADAPTSEQALGASGGALIGLNADANCVALLAGQTLNSGMVCATVDNEADTSAECGAAGAKGTMRIEYATIDGWQLVEAHMAVGDDVGDLPANKKGNPKVGNFPYHSGDITGATSYSFVVPLCHLGLDMSQTECAPVTAYIAAHAVVRKDNGDGSFQTETGWGDGQPFVAKGSWATWFTQTLECYEPCVPGFDAEAFEAALDQIDGESQEIGMRVVHQGGNAAKPYFFASLDYDHDGVAEVTGLPAYCVDLAHTIASNKNYCVRIYSTYSDNLPADVQIPENFDQVNFLLNNYAIGDIAETDGLPFTGGDLQRAIWSLVYGELPSPGGYSSGPSSNARVQELIAAASVAGVGFQPPCDGVVGVVLFPVDCANAQSPAAGQVLIAQMLMTTFEASCNVCE